MSVTGSLPVVLHPIHPPGLADLLRPLAGIELVTPDPAHLEDALRSCAVGLITYLWDDRFLGDHLRWIQAVSAGTDQFPLSLLHDKGVTLTSARGAHSPAVADHAVALLFSLLRHIGPAVRRSVDHVWQVEMAHESEGLTAGIIGLGSIGEAIAQRLMALGLQVIGCKRHPDRYDGSVDHVVGPADIGTIFSMCDAVVISLPTRAKRRG